MENEYLDTENQREAQIERILTQLKPNVINPMLNKNAYAIMTGGLRRLTYTELLALATVIYGHNVKMKNDYASWENKLVSFYRNRVNMIKNGIDPDASDAPDAPDSLLKHD